MYQPTRRKKTEFTPVVICLKIDLVSPLDCGESVIQIHKPHDLIVCSGFKQPGTTVVNPCYWIYYK